METPGPQEVGREFVRQYYTMLNEAPLHLHRFYSNNSAFVHGGVEKAGMEQPPVVGQEAIHKKIMSLGFNDCHAKIRQVDSQATVEDSVVVQVTGELSNNGEPMRRFMQTFVLVPQTPKKFYVHNDIFRYQDEVFHEEDESEEDRKKSFITDPRQEIIENGAPEPAPVAQEVQNNYYEQTPMTNGTSTVHEVEAMKAPEPTPQIVSSPPQPPKQEVESNQSVDSGHVEDLSAARDEQFEEKADSKPSPVPEPAQPEYQEPAERKPVTWAALASKGTGAPQAQSYNAAPSHINKPAPVRSDNQVRSEQTKHEGAPSQPPQGQRAPRAPRDRFGGDRDRNSMSRGGEGDGDNDSLNGRRSNSVGGNGGISSKYSDRQQLFVGNLPLNITERELKEFFEQYGKVEELRINTKSGGGKLPNFGFVVFESTETVKEILVIKNAEGIKYNGEHRLNVEEKKARGSDGFRGGRGGMGRGGNTGQGMGRGPYNSGRGGIKNGGGFGRQEGSMRGGTSNIGGQRGGMTQQGRR